MERSGVSYIVAAVGAIAIAALSYYGYMHMKKSENGVAIAGICDVSESACNLRRAMSKLWSDHVFWTRLYIISELDSKPDLQATTQRLLNNQKDIGAAVVPYYGQAGGDQLAQLLTDHILIGSEVVKAAKSGDKQLLAQEDKRWHANADEIAQFLNKANPKNWNEKEMRDMLYNHLKLTTDEVVARLHKNWEQDVATFDKVYDQALDMAKGLADGIIAQFPDKF